ncbi:MAG: hypothetical protein HYW71_02180 [Candidatus Niyogibacteria bacterium]|nr:hypothetical protein [Candidatus Niyogibacteria bacterium]
MKKTLFIIAVVLFFIEPAAAEIKKPFYLQDFWKDFSLRLDQKLYSEIKTDGLIRYRLEKLNETRELEKDGRNILVMPGAPVFIFKAVSKAASEPLTEYLNQFELVQNVRELLRKYGRIAFSVSLLTDDTSRNGYYRFNPKAEFELGIKESPELGQNQKIQSLRLKAGFQVVDDKTLINNARDLSLSLRPGVSLEYNWQDFFKAGGRLSLPQSDLTFYFVPDKQFFTVSVISDFVVHDKRLGFYLSKEINNRVFTVRSNYFLETHEAQVTFHFFYQF